MTGAVNFYNREVETRSRDELRTLQDQRLRELMRELTPNRFYQEKSRAAGIELARIEHAEDLHSLPVHDKTRIDR